MIVSRIGDEDATQSNQGALCGKMVGSSTESFEVARSTESFEVARSTESFKVARSTESECLEVTSLTKLKR